MFRKTLAIIMVAVAAGLVGVLGLGPVAAQQQGPSATRSFSSTTVAPGEEVVVTITAADYGLFGSIKETLPEGFRYVSSTLDDEEVRVNGQTVEFTLLASDLFTYTVTAPDTVTATMVHSFTGTLRDFDRMDHDVGGQSDVTVEAAAPAPGPAPPDPSPQRRWRRVTG